MLVGRAPSPDLFFSTPNDTGYRDGDFQGMSRMDWQLDAGQIEVVDDAVAEVLRRGHDMEQEE